MNEVKMSSVVPSALPVLGGWYVGLIIDTRLVTKPDFAIVDIRLAHGDLGTDVAAELGRTTKAEIIFSTGNGNDLSLVASLGDAVMTKPHRMGDVGHGLKNC